MTRRLTESELPRTVRVPQGPLDTIPAPEVLTQPLRAQGDRVELSARRVRAVLSGTQGVQWLEGDGTPLVANLLVEGASAANLVVSPRSARRECFAAGQGFVEVLQVPEALPGAVVQWQWSTPTPLASLPVRFRVLPDQTSQAGAPLHYHREPGLLWVGQGDAGVLVCAPGSLALPLIRRTGEAIQVEWDLPRAEDASIPTSLLIQSAPAEGTWTNPNALAAVAAHFRRGEDAAAGTHESGVSLLTGVDEVDEGMEWSRAWIRDRLLAVPKTPLSAHPVAMEGEPASPWRASSSGAAWLAMAAACTGDREAGRGALGRLAWETPDQIILSSLALARWMAWTGEKGPLSEAQGDLLLLLGEGARELVTGTGDAVVSSAVVQAVREEVAAAGEAAEDDELKALRELPAPVAGGGRRLPTVGGGDGSSALDPLVFPFHPDRTPAQRLEQVLQAREWLGFLSRDATGLQEGVGALAAIQWIAGVVGSQPDATFERLTLAPLFPPNWTRAGLSGLRVGEGALALGYTREESVVRWTVRPLEGSTPLMVILDAWQPLANITGVKVDGEPAELDVHRSGEWSRVQIQIPADAPRVVEIQGGE